MNNLAIRNIMKNFTTYLIDLLKIYLKKNLKNYIMKENYHGKLVIT